MKLLHKYAKFKWRFAGGDTFVYYLINPEFDNSRNCINAAYTCMEADRIYTSGSFPLDRMVLYEGLNELPAKLKGFLTKSKKVV